LGLTFYVYILCLGI